MVQGKAGREVDRLGTGFTCRAGANLILAVCLAAEWIALLAWRRDRRPADEESKNDSGSSESEHDGFIERGEQSLAMALRLYGPDHAGTLLRRRFLALAKRAALMHHGVGTYALHGFRSTPEFGKGRLEEAIAEMGEELATLVADHRRVLGPDDEGTLEALGRWTEWRCELAESTEEGVAALQELLTSQRRVLGQDHPDTIGTLERLASLRETSGDLGEAIGELEEVLACQQRVLGNEHEETLKTRERLAQWREASTNASAVIVNLEQKCAEFVQDAGPDDEFVINAEGDLAWSRARAGHVEESIRELELLLTDRAQVLGMHHIVILTTRRRLAWLRGRPTSGARTGNDRAEDDTDYRISGEINEQLTEHLRRGKSETEDNSKQHQRWTSQMDRVHDQIRMLGEDHPEVRQARAELENDEQLLLAAMAATRRRGDWPTH